jgi:hypothetical protein
MNKLQTQTITFGVVADAQYCDAADDVQHN